MSHEIDDMGFFVAYQMMLGFRRNAGFKAKVQGRNKGRKAKKRLPVAQAIARSAGVGEKSRPNGSFQIFSLVTEMPGSQGPGVFR